MTCSIIAITQFRRGNEYSSAVASGSPAWWAGTNRISAENDVLCSVSNLLCLYIKLSELDFWLTCSIDDF